MNILFIIYGYMEDEVYHFCDMEDLFKFWGVKNLNELRNNFRNETYRIFKVWEILDKKEN